MNNTTYLGLAGPSTQAVLSFLYVGVVCMEMEEHLCTVECSQAGWLYSQYYYQYQLPVTTGLPHLGSFIPAMLANIFAKTVL